MGSSEESKHQYIIQTPDFEYKPDPRGAGYVFYECMLKNQDKLAQIYGPTGEEDTYGNLLKRCIRTAISMKKYGIKSGDFVSICTYNHLDSCTPGIASLFIGAIMAGVDPTLSEQDIAYLLRLVPPKLIFVIPEAVEMIEKVIETISSDTKIVVYGNTTKHVPFSEFLLPQNGENDFKPIEVKSLKNTAVIYFSSGTTGLPKAACHNHYAIICQAVNFANVGLCLDLCIAYASPFWTVFARVLNSCIVGGTARLVYPKFEPENAWKIFDYKLTYVFLNTIQLLTMLKQGRPKNLDISSVKDICTGSSLLMEEQALKAKSVFHDTRFHISYGQTEVAGSLLHFKPSKDKEIEFLTNKPTSAGTGMPGILYKIVDPETEEILGPNQQGELRVKTEFQLNGYHNMDLSGIWDSDGWLKTGDMMYYDEDNCFYIVSRLKEMFKFQCWHIVPAMIENVILSHPAIASAVVIGIPHEMDGSHPMGIVILKPSYRSVTPQEIVKYVDEKVSDRQRLRAGVKIVESLPTTTSGKIKRKAIEAMVLQGEI